ncbi:DnaA/Hda family protein [Thalassobaculum sp. OXR-137]|uniref:DnaA ATPase domain-containing protein n=1 Tax=Thalassobaculum sp. OXR-137 TaxID=3100173 RepID=UPI002AC973C8|nr:DnaA/Hda family protein [Thalassobaculum sp. OXR-137]WPZ33601.1 DnaA/Hda family protein [Thalassobaculum sp. OXR-137]
MTTSPDAAARRQLALDLGFRPALGRADFLVGASNAEAAAWIDRWPDWPEPARGLAIVGPSGSGKNHLAAVWQAASGAALVDAPALSSDIVPDALGDARNAVVDRVDGGIDEPALFHLFNMVVERGGSLVILSRTPPARMEISLPDLASRLATLPVATIGLPDEALLAGVLAKHFADRQVLVRDDVIAYLVNRMERSFDAAERLADRMDRAALEGDGKISMRVARLAMADEDMGDADGQ